MKTLILMTLLAFCLLGVMAAPAAAQALGPVCMQIVEFDELTQFFALPNGEAQAILTGESLTYGDAYTGSGYVTDNHFIFSLASGLLPGLIEGDIDMATRQGVGSVTFSDNGEVQSLTYVTYDPPCGSGPPSE